MYNFKLGERKEVGGTLTRIDGTDFSISATYVFKNHSGTIISSGNASVSGADVFVLLQPATVGKYYEVVFTCVCTPLTSQGVPDNTKNAETIIAEVRVDVVAV